jgi:hypothetical protein
VEKAHELTLKITSDGAGKKNSLFLANTRLVTTGGKEMPVAVTEITADNVVDTARKPSEDYYGGPIKITGVHYDSAIATQPKDNKHPALLHIPLAGKNAVRFKATLGGDYPLGNESERRKVYAIRSQGTEAHFLTVLEPYEDKAVVKSATATSPDTLRVELTDGRTQEITIQNLNGSWKDISVQIKEMKAGQVVRRETTSATID